MRVNSKNKRENVPSALCALRHHHGVMRIRVRATAAATASSAAASSAATTSSAAAATTTSYGARLRSWTARETFRHRRERHRHRERVVRFRVLDCREIEL